ncbi:MAG TPA: hypothetical protein VNJ47_01250 [Nevskiales bacterium]|nr:hypothetical protein [Nevskiales bacterium]
MTEAEPAPTRELNSHIEFREAACALVRGARLQLNILTYAFEREIYGHPDFVQAVQKLATQHARARVRILIHSPDWASRSGHRLVELARRLSSFIELRELNEQDKQLTGEVLIADENALLYRESPDTMQARYFPDDPRQASPWLRRFEGLWTGGEIVQGLRRLNT